jgi:predicted DNA-binding transcriptional regulator AlpA
MSKVSSNIQRPGIFSPTEASPAAPSKILIGKKELASLLCVNPWTIDRWRKKRKDFPPPIWISDCTPRWYLQEIEQWLASQRRGGIAPSWTSAKDHRDAG